MNSEQADEIYDVLVEHCDAKEFMRDDFVDYITKESSEIYRFAGSVGHSGTYVKKFNMVHCSEDDYDANKKIVDGVNEVLKNTSYVGEKVPYGYVDIPYGLIIFVILIISILWILT